MSDKAIKQIRGQVRQIIQEILPELLKSELMKELDKQLISHIKKIEIQVKDQLHEINERHKDTMSYLVRQVTVKPEDTKKGE